MDTDYSRGAVSLFVMSGFENVEFKLYTIGLLIYFILRLRDEIQGNFSQERWDEKRKQE